MCLYVMVKIIIHSFIVDVLYGSTDEFNYYYYYKSSFFGKIGSLKVHCYVAVNDT